jgi:hypothetical protein
LGPLVATVFAAFAFWPQVGVLGQDLYFTNSVDLEPAAAATLDPWCGSRTYDTHTGDDVVIRSLREAAIGVSVFSVTDGTVSEVQDVKVRTGQQLGWSGSSGNSSWPHLHFTEIVDGQIREAFAGACRAGTSDFALQLQPFRDATYVRNLVVSPRPFRGEAKLPWDKPVRTGTFVTGVRDVWFRVELGEWAGGAELDGKLLADAPLLVVARAQQARNRAPNPVSVTLSVQGSAQCVSRHPS